MEAWIDLLDRLNPLVRREMRRVTRIGRNYLLLLIVPAMLLLALLNWPLLGLLSARGSSDIPSLHLLKAFVVAAYYISIFVMPALAASAVSFERDSGSMDMLRTAGLGGGRILSGKTNGLLLLFALILLTGLPIVSGVMVYGGIAAKDLAALYLVALFAGLRAMAFGFLGYGLTGRTVTGAVFAYVGLFGWAWGVESFALWLPEFRPYVMLLEPREAMQAFIEAGTLPTVQMLGADRPFWWMTCLLLLIQSVGCYFLAAPLVVAGSSQRQSATPSIARWTRWRTFRREHLVPNQCNIIFERDFRSGIFNGSWFLWALWPVVIVPGFLVAAYFWTPFIEVMRIAVGVPLLILVGIRSATTINRMRENSVMTQVFMTNVSPRGMVQGKVFYILVTTLPWIIAAFIADSLMGYPSTVVSLPLHKLSSAFLDTAISSQPDELIGRTVAGFFAYLTPVVYVLAISVLGLRFSVQNNNSTTAVLHTLGWGALLVFVANLVLVFASTGILLLFHLLVGLLAGGQGAGLMAIRLAPSIIFFGIWAAYLIKWSFEQMNEATRSLHRSLKTDEFAAPPSLYELGKQQEFEVETWGEPENPYY